MKLSNKRYLQGFCLVVILLATVRCLFPSIASPNSADSPKRSSVKNNSENGKDVAVSHCALNYSISNKKTQFFDKDGKPLKHRIFSVNNFLKAFPDQNDVQLVSANHYGVKPVEDRVEAEKRKSELVYIGSNPYFEVDKLNNSIPYLVPNAANLLSDIGRSFFDSLQIKGVPLHKIIVTSVTRSKDDVAKLRGRNGNATENSCHLYGTTFDVSYNRYITVRDPESNNGRSVRNDSLKWILSEVLNDLRESNKCYVKYEIKQGCFHITIR